MVKQKTIIFNLKDEKNIMYSYCGVVVLYKPDKKVIQNIISYINSIDKLYIIDNSDNSDFFLQLNDKKLKSKCEYIPFYKNYGLAYGLNFGCKKAIEDKFDYVLTMDQDSYFEKDSVDLLKQYIIHNKKCGIACPEIFSLHLDENTGEEKGEFLCECEDNQPINWTMTSGSLMSLKAYEIIDGFDNNLFIGHIDVDTGIKLFKNNYSIIRVKDSIIYQHFGNSKPKRILFKTIHPYYGLPVRTYYTFRNQKYIELKYGRKWNHFTGIRLGKAIIKTALFEQNKLQHFKMMICGIRHAKKGIMGEYKPSK